jgi:hypothetical protein
VIRVVVREVAEDEVTERDVRDPHDRLGARERDIFGTWRALVERQPRRPRR